MFNSLYSSVKISRFLLISKKLSPAEMVNAPAPAIAPVRSTIFQRGALRIVLLSILLEVFWYGIMAMATPRVAGKDPFYGKKTAFERTESAERLRSIFGTGRRESA